jgi:hypothetical protein
MRSLCFLSLGLLLAAGCADTADDYEVNKPVITDPAPSVPAAQPDSDLDLDADLDSDLDADDNAAIDDATDNNDATLNSATPGAAGSSPATNGAIEDDATVDETQPVTP